MLFKLNAKNNLGFISLIKFFHVFHKICSDFVNSGVSMFSTNLSKDFNFLIMLGI